MKPDCPECARAQLAPWRSYSGHCPDCVIRQIANMLQADREPVYERIQRECGRAALDCVKERVGLEIVRMRLLREGMQPVE
jgi:hypothetical protein